MSKLSVAIITLNEELRLPLCLASIAGLADDILVVDSGSTDATVEIAQKSGARVIQHPWTGYADQREFARQNVEGDWCLMLDADERISPDLRNAIAAAITQDDVAAFSIPFQTVLFGQPLTHGTSKYERHIRLFQTKNARWVQQGSRDLVKVDGRVGRVRPPILHEPCSSVADFMQTMNTKTSMLAWEDYQRGMRFSLAAVVRLPMSFLFRYGLMLGFLDGWAGFLDAGFAVISEFVTNAKLLDMERFTQMSEQGTVPLRSLTPGTPLEVMSAPPESLPPSMAKTVDDMPAAEAAPSDSAPKGE